MLTFRGESARMGFDGELKELVVGLASLLHDRGDNAHEITCFVKFDRLSQYHEI